jgi:hypothetical protein
MTTTEQKPLILESADHARKLHGQLRSVWWNAFTAKSNSFDKGKWYADIDKNDGKNMPPREHYEDPSLVAVEQAAKLELERVKEAGKKQFGNNREHPDCEYCLEVSVFGGPNHNASGSCRSGGRAHCSCDICW